MNANATAIEIRMPSLGADMTEGRVIEWLVAPGDHLDRGDLIAVVHTDKADIEIEVFEAGIVRSFLVPVDEVVPVGTPIMLLESAPHAGVEPAPEPSSASSSSAPQPVAVPGRAATTDETPPARVEEHRRRVVSPLVRHLAELEHVDLERIEPSGPGGRVLRADVERAARARVRITPRARRLAATGALSGEQLSALAAGGTVVTGDDVLTAIAERPAPRPVTTDRPGADPMRQRIAALMSRSWDEIPHYHVERRLDLAIVLDRLARYNEGRPVAERVLPAAALIAAVARAARRVPACNGWWRDGRFEPADRVDVGVVLSLRSGGILAPTISRAHELDLAAIMARLRDLVTRARQARLRASDVAEASITVTNLGDQGADAVFGVIHPPQVALVGFGAIRDDVWAVDGTVVIRPTTRATLSGDHRATDGLAGSQFLAELQRALDELIDEPALEETP